jgi:hypothetical protein
MNVAERSVTACRPSARGVVVAIGAGADDVAGAGDGPGFDVDCADAFAPSASPSASVTKPARALRENGMAAQLPICGKTTWSVEITVSTLTITTVVHAIALNATPFVHLPIRLLLFTRSSISTSTTGRSAPLSTCE